MGHQTIKRDGKAKAIFGFVNLTIFADCVVDISGWIVNKNRALKVIMFLIIVCLTT